MDYRECSKDELGRFGEAVCSNVLKASGFTYIPLCQLTGRGAPLATSKQGKVILPDFDVADLRAYIDAKCKMHAILYRAKGELRHGINKRNYEHYVHMGVTAQRMCGLLIVEFFTDEQMAVWSGAILTESFRMLGNPHAGFNEETEKVYWPRNRFAVLSKFSPEELRQVANGHLMPDFGFQLRQLFSAPPKVCVTHPRDAWVDESPVNGMIRTHCGICGTYIGRRPVDLATNRKRIAQE